MKRYMFLALTLVLTASVLMGCGCTNREVENTSMPTVLPTNEELWESTESTTRTTTESTMTTMPSETHDRGNGPLEDATGTTTTGTESTESMETTGTAEGRTRGMMPGRQ